jgi:hypothetical protein
MSIAIDITNNSIMLWGFNSVHSGFINGIHVTAQACFAVMLFHRIKNNKLWYMQTASHKSFRHNVPCDREMPTDTSLEITTFNFNSVHHNNNNEPQAS